MFITVKKNPCSAFGGLLGRYRNLKLRIQGDFPFPDRFKGQIQRHQLHDVTHAHLRVPVLVLHHQICIRISQRVGRRRDGVHLRRLINIRSLRFREISGYKRRQNENIQCGDHHRPADYFRPEPFDPYALFHLCDTPFR